MTTSQTAVRPNILIRKRQSGLAFIVLDAAGKHNLLSTNVIDEFRENVRLVKDDPEIKAVAFISGKPDTFLSGADLHEIIKFTTADQAEDLSRRGQRVFNEIANLGKPTVVAINGVCLGGGLELALCCNRRIATDSESTLIGLPEVKLGFVPGLGGTQRLPRLIGIRNSLEIVLTGDPVSAKRAQELGIVDKLTIADKLMDDAEAEAIELLHSGKWQSPDEVASKAAGELTPEKMKSLFGMAERSVRIRTRGNYPAQTKVLEAMKHGLEQGITAGLDLEARIFGELSISDISKNLVFLYFTTEFARQSALSLAAKPDTARVKTIGIIGGGIMGTTIAQFAAQQGMTVLLQAAQEGRQDALAQRVAEINQRLEKANEGKSVTPKVQAVVDGSEFKKADLIIEACAEDMTIKVPVLNRLAAACEPGAVIASNTSSLSITTLAKELPEHISLVGTHFFNPVDKMPLVEIVSPQRADKRATAMVTAFAAQLGKTPVAVKDSTCFLVNRIMYCYLLEAARMAVEKIPINWGEEAAIDFGMPMGPWALLDEVGWDVAVMVARALEATFGERLKSVDELFQAFEMGLVGRKTGRGIYNWDEAGRKIGFDQAAVEKFGLVVSPEKVSKETAQKLTSRMILPMVDEAARCLEEKVVRRPREIDLCMVLGIGFPPFRGGLLRYADAVGLPSVIEALKTIYSQTGAQRTISPYLAKLASENRGFYSRSAGDEN
jgi:3-hydroxyacyl-CoA dehydrogenase/enoyl-CoA hydratase/3-hydroxybutyryl-CoA epimerase